MPAARAAAKAVRTAAVRSAAAARPSGDRQARAAKPLDMVGRIESGLKVAVIDGVARDLAVPAAAVRKLAKIRASTFGRRQKAGRLSAEESDRVDRLRSVVDRTTAFFDGDKVAARQ